MKLLLPIHVSSLRAKSRPSRALVAQMISLRPAKRRVRRHKRALTILK